MENNLGSFADHCIASFSTDIEENRATIILTDTLPPYKERKVICEGVIAFRFYRSEDSDAPYFCEEFYWNNCGSNLGQILNDIQYPFFNSWPGRADNLLVPQANYCCLYFEGNACGCVVCKTISTDENECGVE